MSLLSVLPEILVICGDSFLSLAISHYSLAWECGSKRMCMHVWFRPVTDARTVLCYPLHSTGPNIYVCTFYPILSTNQSYLSSMLSTYSCWNMTWLDRGLVQGQRSWRRQGSRRRHGSWRKRKSLHRLFSFIPFSLFSSSLFPARCSYPTPPLL